MNKLSLLNIVALALIATQARATADVKVTAINKVGSPITIECYEKIEQYEKYDDDAEPVWEWSIKHLDQGDHRTIIKHLTPGKYQISAYKSSLDRKHPMNNTVWFTIPKDIDGSRAITIEVNKAGVALISADNGIKAVASNHKKDRKSGTLTKTKGSRRMKTNATTWASAREAAKNAKQ